MISTSVRSTRRSTPCVLGCSGPMFTNISSVRTSNSTMVWSCAGGVAVAMLSSTAANAVVLQRELVVLAQRVPHPVLGQENAAQVGVAGEPDAGQVVNLVLVPVGGPPDARHRRHLRQLARLVVLPARQQHLEDEAVPVRETLQV